MPDRRDPDRIRHAMFEMVMSRVLAIACGHEDAIDLDRLRHDPLMKLAVGRCPESGQPLASQSTISRLENAPSKTAASVRPAICPTQETHRRFCRRQPVIQWRLAASAAPACEILRLRLRKVPDSHSKLVFPRVASRINPAPQPL
jgi:hypothetical protein